MLSLWISILVSLIFYGYVGIVVEGQSIGYVIRNATNENMNGIYICISSRACNSLNNQFQVSSASVYVASGVQKRWYIEKILNPSSTQRVYQAIEESYKPFELSKWKKLIGKQLAAFPDERYLEMLPWSPYCSSDSPIIHNLETTKVIVDVLMRFSFTNHSQSTLLRTSVEECFSAHLTDISPELIEDIEILKCQYHLVTSNVEEFKLCGCKFLKSEQQIQGDESHSRLKPLLLYALYTAFVEMDWSVSNMIYCTTSHAVASMNEEIKTILALKWMELYMLGMDTYRFSMSFQGDTPVVHVIFPSNICTIFSKQSLSDAIVFPLTDLMEHISSIESIVMKFPLMSSSVKDIFVRITFFLTQLQRHINTSILPTLPMDDSASTMKEWTGNANQSIEQYLLRQQISYSSSLISTLLGMGAIEISGIHTMNLLLQEKRSIAMRSSRGELTFDTAESQLAQCISLSYSQVSSYCSALCKTLTLQSIKQVVNTLSEEQVDFFISFFAADSTTSDDTLSTEQLYDKISLEIEASMKKSLSVRMLTMLSLILLSEGSSDLWDNIVTNEQLYHIVISVLSQICNPVILSIADVTAQNLSNLTPFNMNWLKEIVILRMLSVNLQQPMLCACRGDDGEGIKAMKCWLDDHILSSINRGLFLEAYQGMGLIVNFHKNLYQLSKRQLQKLPNWLYDGYVTSLYQTFMHSFAPHVEMPGLELQAKNDSEDDRIIPIAFVCNSLTRHSVGRLLSYIIAGLAATNDTNNVQFDVYLITSTPHPENFESGSTSSFTGKEYDDISYYLATKIPASHWLLYPTVSTSIFDHKTSSLILHPTWQRFLSHLKDVIELEIAIFTDVLMQPVQMIWSQQVRLAPRQVVFWGHPYSTGNTPFMDYFITSDSFEPNTLRASRSDEFTEQLVHFDSLSFQLYSAEPTSTALPFSTVRNNLHSCKVTDYFPLDSADAHRYKTLQWLLTEGYSINGTILSSNELLSFLYHHQSFDVNVMTEETTDCTKLAAAVPRLHLYSLIQSLMKMHPLLDIYILRLLVTDPMAIILVSRNMKQSFWQLAWQRRLAHTAKQLYPSLLSSVLLQRIIFVNGMKHAEYSQLICSVDVVIDSFPFGGGVTMCDAIGGACLEAVTKSRYSIPFVTSGYLQSVHRIAQGIHERVTSTVGWEEVSAAVNASSADKLHNQIVQLSRHMTTMNTSMAELMMVYYEQHIDVYVQETIRLMHQSRQRGRMYKPSSTSRDEPVYAIYEDLTALQEWKAFLTRIVS